jgi:uncharacterized FAD-dependent dehydrogenase
MSKCENYDVAVIGCGIAGIYAAYELVGLNPGLRVIVLEQGADIRNRSCPIVAHKTTECLSCATCAIMRGFGGAGAYSDGKYNFTTEFGGWLKDYRPEPEIMSLINYVDSVNVHFGATEVVYSTESEKALKLEKKALENDLHLLAAKVKHLGTENNLQILKNIYDYMVDKVTLRFGTSVQNIDARPDGYRLETSGGDVACRYLIAAPGRSGAEWFSDQCRKLGLDIINNQVDIGVRVELPAKVFEHITDAVYESKLLYRTKQYGDTVRTFCMNPYGHVVTENVDGLMTVNGHSYSDPALRSDNTNFALLVSNRFTEPFKEPYRYGKHIASLSNMLSGGVLIQRFGDLLKGTRTNEHRLSKSFVKPTLQATPGDLSLVLPKRHMDNIIEMLFALDKIAPGTANYDTLLYGVEVKFYSSRPQLTPSLETNLPNFYAIGDGAGITRGLAQAAASGVIAARAIHEKIEANN